MSEPVDLSVVVDRARKLLALAASSSSDAEARTAALAAARLIATHGLRVVTQEQAVDAAQGDWWAAAVRAARESRRDPGAPASAAPQSSDKIVPRSMEAKFKGACRVCGGSFWPGDAIWYFALDGHARTAHFECWDPE